MKQLFRILFHCLFEKKRGNSCNSISTRNTKHSFAYWNSFPPPGKRSWGAKIISLFFQPLQIPNHSLLFPPARNWMYNLAYNRAQIHRHITSPRERERALSCALSSYRLGSWLIKIVPSRARSVVCWPWPPMVANSFPLGQQPFWTHKEEEGEKEAKSNQHSLNGAVVVG